MGELFAGHLAADLHHVGPDVALSLADGDIVPGLAVLAFGLVMNGELGTVGQLLEAFGFRVGFLAQGGDGPGIHGAIKSLTVPLRLGGRGGLRLALGDVVRLHVAVVAAALQEPPTVLQLIEGHDGVFFDLAAHGLILGAGASAHVHLVRIHVPALGVLLLGGGRRGVDPRGGGRRGRDRGIDGLLLAIVRLVAAVRLKVGARAGGGDAIGASLLQKGRQVRTGIGEGRDADLEGDLTGVGDAPGADLGPRDGHRGIPPHTRSHHGIVRGAHRGVVHTYIGPGEAQEPVGLVLQIAVDRQIAAIVHLGVQEDHGAKAVVEEGLLGRGLLPHGIDHGSLGLARGIEAEGAVHHIPLAHGHVGIIDERIKDQLLHRGHPGGAQLLGGDQDLPQDGLASGHLGLITPVLHVAVHGQVGQGHHKIPGVGLVDGFELQRQPHQRIEGLLRQHEGKQGALGDGLLAHIAGPIPQRRDGRRGLLDLRLGHRRGLGHLQHGGIASAARQRQEHQRRQ